MARTTRGTSLDRLLRVFADVRPGEGFTALLLSVNVFLILAAYYIIKPLRDALVISEYSAEVKSYLSAVIVLMLALVVPAYGILADRFPRRRLINVVTWIFSASFVTLYLLGEARFRLGIPLFVWGSMFNVMVVAQFWSFANDLYSREEGERLFPIVAVGASLGAVAGPTVVKEMVRDLGVYLPMLIAAAVLVIEVQLTNYIDSRERRLRESHLPDIKTTATLAATGTFKMPGTLEELEEAAEKERELYEAIARGKTVEDYDAPPSGKGAFGLVLSTPYLLLICLLVMLLNWVNTNGEYVLSAVFQSAAAGVADGRSTAEIIGGYYAAFYQGVNTAALLIQLFVVSRVVKHVGVRFAVMILPMISLGAYAIIGFFPVLAAIRWAKTGENSVDYSLNNTVRQALFLPTTREQKYKGKQVSDSFFHRAGDVLSAVTVFLGSKVLVLGTAGFAMFNLALAAVWLAIAFVIGRQYHLLVQTGRPPQPRGGAAAPKFAPGVSI